MKKIKVIINFEDGTKTEDIYDSIKEASVELQDNYDSMCGDDEDFAENVIFPLLTAVEMGVDYCDEEDDEFYIFEGGAM